MTSSKEKPPEEKPSEEKPQVPKKQTLQEMKKSMEEKRLEAKRRFEEEEVRMFKFQKAEKIAQTVLEIVHSEKADLSMVLSILQGTVSETEDLSK